MSFARIFIWIAVLTGIATASSAAMAGPVLCSVNNQDSTCVGHLTTAWEAPPTCPDQPGWTTAAPAQWIGSQYSAPQCNYQAPPTCPANFTQTSPPTWTGSGWTSPGCSAPQTPPPPTQPPGNLAAICETAISNYAARAGVHYGPWGTMQGPYPVTASNPYSPQFQGGGWGSTGPGGVGPADFYYIPDLGASGNNGVCWFQSGTSNLTGYDYMMPFGYDGGGDGGSGG